MDVVAELMIMANSAVAQRIHEAFPGQAILRGHRPPDRTRLAELEAAAQDLLESSRGLLAAPTPAQVRARARVVLLCWFCVYGVTSTVVCVRAVSGVLCGARRVPV